MDECLEKWPKLKLVSNGLAKQRNQFHLMNKIPTSNVLVNEKHLFYELGQNIYHLRSYSFSNILILLEVYIRKSFHIKYAMQNKMVDS